MLVTQRNRPVAPFGTLALFDELWPTAATTERGYLPALDVAENNEAYIVRLETPGYNRDQITIEFHDNTLTVSGEKTEEKRDERLHRVERRSGSFTRSVRFDNVNAENIAASYENGLLQVTLPKPEESKPRTIELS